MPKHWNSSIWLANGFRPSCQAPGAFIYAQLHHVSRLQAA